MTPTVGSSGVPAGRGSVSRRRWTTLRNVVARPELSVPLVYAAFAGAWIAASDLVLAFVTRSTEQQAAWSMVKGFAFVIVTAILLHLGVRRALGRERRAHRRVETSEALLQTIADSIPDPVLLKDRECRWLFANPATLRVIGRTLEQVLGRTDREIYDDPAVGEALVATDRRIMDAGVGEVVEELIQTPAGYRVFLSTKAPYRDLEGRVVGVIGNARDITERKRMEKALQGQLALEDQLARIAASVPGLVCSFRLGPDGSACMPFTTPAVEDLYGLSQEALARDVAPWAANVHPDDLARVNEAIARAARTMSRWHDEYRYLHPTKGLRWIEGWSVPRTEPDGSILFHGYVTDVTERKLAVAEQRRLEEQFQQAQRLESVGRLAGGVAHDFNNLLTIVLSCAEALAHDLRDGAPDPEDVQEIRAAGERARDLTRQLLAFARRQVIAPVALDMNEVVLGSEKLLRRVLGEDVELAVSPQPELWPTRADPGQMEQVILNLAVNARDAMPRGGTLAIDTANVRLDGGASDPLGARAGDYVRMAVRDSGQGMSPEAKAHLFEPFFTTKPLGEGTGLGLATVYGIVRQSEGHVRVESEPGRGTTVEIYLPRSLEAAVAKAKPSPPAASTRGTESILVVEDDPRVREVTVRALRAGGYRVEVATSGREALAVGDGELGALDLLVTDLVMPGLDGRSVAEELRRRRPGLPVLFVSGYPQPAVGEGGGFEPGTEFLPKPFAPSVLLARVRAILDAR